MLGRRLDNHSLSSDTRQMGLDPELVREAEAARERLVESQHAAERAKVDYHHAIRRLHAAGGSLREIAEALRVSHQRVHQIIDEAAEPTRPSWRRRPQRPQGPPGPCSFCGRSREECAKLIAGPGVFICERCVADATWLSAHASVEEQAQGPMRLEAPGSEVRCSFCGKEARQVAFLVASGLAAAPGGKFGQGARICDECLNLCMAILAETSS
jgi:ClpX C4-type zinc finger protein